MKSLFHISQSSESIHISNRVCFHSILLTPGCMLWGGAGGQNIEHPHILSGFEFIFFFVKCILILLARRDSGKLRCPATALIVVVFCLGFRIAWWPSAGKELPSWLSTSCWLSTCTGLFLMSSLVFVFLCHLVS